MRYLALIAALAITGCREDVASAPDPVPMTADALSFFCQMNISEHAGPKGQIHLKGLPAPIFFAQVRDLVAYLKSPERDADITAIYVSDMTHAPSWQAVGPDNWVSATQAHFVIEAGVAGGMGAPEIVPFSDLSAAKTFVGLYGGRIVLLENIPDAVAIAPVDLDAVLEEPA